MKHCFWISSGKAPFELKYFVKLCYCKIQIRSAMSISILLVQLQKNFDSNYENLSIYHRFWSLVCDVKTSVRLVDSF